MPNRCEEAAAAAAFGLLLETAPFISRVSHEVQVSSCKSTVKAWTAHTNGGSWNTSWRPNDGEATAGAAVAAAVVVVGMWGWAWARVAALAHAPLHPEMQTKPTRTSPRSQKRPGGVVVLALSITFKQHRALSLPALNVSVVEQANHILIDSLGFRAPPQCVFQTPLPHSLPSSLREDVLYNAVLKSGRGHREKGG